MKIKLQKAYMLVYLIDTYYEYESAGGSCHILLDDGNYGLKNAEFCLKRAKERNDYFGIKIAELLCEFSEEEQEQIVERSWEIKEKIVEKIHNAPLEENNEDINKITLQASKSIEEQVRAPKCVRDRNSKRYKAYCKTSENGFSEYFVVYDFNNKEVARSGNYHPEGLKEFSWNGFVFMAEPYSGDKENECYVKINDKVILKD